MIPDQTLRARQKLVSKLPISGELLRGSLLDRTVRHTKDCPKCARGEGNRVFVLTAARAGRGGAPVAEQLSGTEGGDRGCLRTYCNHDLLRPERAVSTARRKPHD